MSGASFLNDEAIETRPDNNGALRVANPKQRPRMRSKLAMVFQHFNLWSHMTVLQNVMEAPMQVLGLAACRT